ncbi:uncharacterized protein TNCV_1500521 [Trichonephila clavipes]|nr:uncharacterized protein TNCV_1500521 [Trichonephila clavipes]
MWNKNSSTSMLQHGSEGVLAWGCKLASELVGPDFILIYDNTRPHRAHLVDEFLESVDIHRMDWPVRSPILIHIERTWDALGWANANRNSAPRII